MGEREFAAVAAELVAAAGADPTGARTVVPSQPDGASTGGGVAPVGDPTRGHPPQGGFYDHPTHPEPRYLWRWIGMEGPDLVVEVEHGAGETWFVPDADQPGAELPQLRELAGLLPDARPLPAGDDLVTQLVRQKPCDVGVVPAVRVVTSGGGFVATLDRALARMRLPPSPARLELDRRAARSPREIAGQLLEVYGSSAGCGRNGSTAARLRPRPPWCSRRPRRISTAAGRRSTRMRAARAFPATSCSANWPTPPVTGDTSSWCWPRRTPPSMRMAGHASRCRHTTR
jgi:hypothetical protein